MSKPIYTNREISWLSFNYRVLQEAADETVPLIERLKFLGIYSSNLDEFFSVRVGTLRRIIQSKVHSASFLGGSPKKVARDIQQIVLKNTRLFNTLLSHIKEELEKHHIYIITETGLNAKQSAYVHNYFNTRVRSRLIPIMLNDSIPFPYLKNVALYFVVVLSNRHSKTPPDYALIEIPRDVLPRFIVLPQADSKTYVILLDDIIRCGLKDIFSLFDYDSYQAFTVKMTRDAEIDIRDDITKSFFEKISRSLKQRQTGYPVRIAYDRQLPDNLLNHILANIGLLNFRNLIPGGRYHNSKDYIKFPRIGPPDLIYEKMPPLPHKDITPGKSLFTVMAKKDIMLHYPYQSFHYFIDLLREAAIDPRVSAIKMTLYRVAENSSVINALINAVRNGKEVTVVVELQARFDERANIIWTRKLEEAGAKVISGIPSMKVHAKLCLISRLENNKQKLYAAVCTGNFNEETAQLYTDKALFTAHHKIPKEVAKVFVFLENNYKSFVYKKLLVAPFNFKRKLHALIDNEAKHAKKGLAAKIWIKVNSISDKKTINKLYKASQAGVEVYMIVRGICCLVPQVKGLSDNITVISIVDRFLEHSRIYSFLNNGNRKFYIGSADLMVRNIHNRVEVCVPVFSDALKQELADFLDIQFSDTRKARIQDQAMRNHYVAQTGPPLRAQYAFYDYLKRKHQHPLGEE